MEQSQGITCFNDNFDYSINYCWDLRTLFNECRCSQTKFLWSPFSGPRASVQHAARDGLEQRAWCELGTFFWGGTGRAEAEYALSSGAPREQRSERVCRRRLRRELHRARLRLSTRASCRQSARASRTQPTPNAFWRATASWTHVQALVERLNREQDLPAFVLSVRVRLARLAALSTLAHAFSSPALAPTAAADSCLENLRFKSTRALRQELPAAASNESFGNGDSSTSLVVDASIPVCASAADACPQFNRTFVVRAELSIASDPLPPPPAFSWTRWFLSETFTRPMFFLIHTSAFVYTLELLEYFDCSWIFLL